MTLIQSRSFSYADAVNKKPVPAPVQIQVPVPVPVPEPEVTPHYRTLIDLSNILNLFYFKKIQVSAVYDFINNIKLPKAYEKYEHKIFIFCSKSYQGYHNLPYDNSEDHKLRESFDNRLDSVLLKWRKVLDKKIKNNVNLSYKIIMRPRRKIENTESDVDNLMHDEVENQIKNGPESYYNMMQIITGDGNDNNKGVTFVDDVYHSLKNGWYVEVISPSWQSNNLNFAAKKYKSRRFPF